MARPRARSLALLVLLGLAAGIGGGTWAAFSATTTNTGSSFSTAGDGVPPSASASVIQKSEGGIVGNIRQGGQYRVFANVTDGGSPPSGVASVTANVSSISAGQTAVSLTAGSYTAGGVSYNYRSGLITADNPLSAGSKSYSLTMTDSASNSQTQGGFTVTVDNTAPAGSDIQTANGGATVGKAEAGDTITYTFTKAIDPESVLAGWTGSSTSVTVRIVDSGNNDFVQIWNSANSAQLPMGQVELKRDYVGATVNFTSSTMVMSGATVTVTLGTPSGATNTVNPASTMTWTPSGSPFGPAGNAVSTTATNEAVPPGDQEF